MDSVATSVFVIFVYFATAVTGQKACQRPDVPANGSYELKKDIYSPGDTIEYNCNPEFHMFGFNERTCNSSGEWTHSTPFCDAATELGFPVLSSDGWTAASRDRLAIYSIDRNISTCLKSKEFSGHTITVPLKESAVVLLVRINLRRGHVHFRVEATLGGKDVMHEDIEGSLGRKAWIDVTFGNKKRKAGKIVIRHKASNPSPLEICEIEVYAKKEGWCEEAPTKQIPNGRLIVGRDKASIECAKGYRASIFKNLLCENNKWIENLAKCEEILCDDQEYNFTEGARWVTKGNTGKSTVGAVKELKCDEGYVAVENPLTITCQSNGTWTSSTARCVESKTQKQTETNLHIVALASSIVAGIAVFSCLITILYHILRKRSKQIVVVLNETSNEYHVHPMPSTSPEAEYATIVYEDLPPPLAACEDPMLPGTHQYSRPADALPPYKNLEFDYAPKYTETQDSLLRDNSCSDTCGDWKQSAFYSS